MQAQETLRKYFGHEAFRPGQEVMVNALTHHRDALGVMPTGAGKSMCYQVPALMMPGVAIVISPLISLMADQVAALKKRGRSSCVPQQFAHPAPDGARHAARAAGRVQNHLRRPGRLETPSFQTMAQSMPISLLAVDEAHCVSQWGAGFPPGVSAHRGFRRFAAHPPGHGRIHRDRNRARPAGHHPPIAPAKPGNGHDRLRPPEPLLRGHPPKEP